MSNLIGQGVEVMRSLRASPVFSLVVLVALGLFGLIGLMLFGGQLGVEAIAAMGHFSSLDHRLHDLTYSFLFGVAVVGLLAQLRAPSKNVAGQLMALIPWVAFVAAFALGDSLVVLLRPPFVPIFGGLVVLATVLHPTGRGLFSSFSVSRVNGVMLALVIIAAVPLLVFASTNIGLQRTVINTHAAQGHYGYMVAFSFTVIGAGLLASLRPNGWRLSAWVAGLLPALLGIASVVFPEADSSLGLGWALASIAWGVVFVAAAELTRDAERLTLLGSLLGSRGVIQKGVRPDHGLTASTPRWLNVFGIAGIVVVLVVVINMVTGVVTGAVTHGPSRHGDASAVADGAVEVAVTADDFAFNPVEISVRTGEDVAIALTSLDIFHDFTIDELDAHIAAGRGETTTGGFRADRPGRYAFYCSVPGHRRAGMEGTLIVREAPTPSDGAVDTPSGGPGGHKPPIQHGP